jgi:hypothetical protein
MISLKDVISSDVVYVSPQDTLRDSFHLAQARSPLFGASGALCDRTRPGRPVRTWATSSTSSSTST